MPSFRAALRPALLSPLLLFLWMQPALVRGAGTSDCLPLGTPVTLNGRLVRVNQDGYVEWIALTLPRPVCVVADSAARVNGANDPVRGVTEIQAFSADKTTEFLLGRFLGKRVTLTGVLSTGVQRFELILKVTSLQPADAAGQVLLSAPGSSPPALRDIPEFEVTVRAGRSLTVEAHEMGTTKPLKPASEYAPHWMTGGEVVYLNCRDGYRHELSTATNRQLMSDNEDVGFGFNAYPSKPLVIKFRCVREDR